MALQTQPPPAPPVPEVELELEVVPPAPPAPPFPPPLALELLAALMLVVEPVLALVLPVLALVESVPLVASEEDWLFEHDAPAARTKRALDRRMVFIEISLAARAIGPARALPIRARHT